MTDTDEHAEARAPMKTFDLLETLVQIEPGSLEIGKTVGEGLILRSPEFGERRNVSVKACFPVTDPHRFLRFTDEDDEELGLLADIAELDERERAVLLEELEKQQFMPIIVKIDAIYREYAIPIWEVRTDRGPRRLELKSTRDVHRLGGGRVYLRDSEGNGYVIPDSGQLDRESRELLELYV